MKESTAMSQWREVKVEGKVFTIKLAPALESAELALTLFAAIAPVWSSVTEFLESREKEADDFVLPEEKVDLTQVAFVLSRQLSRLELAKIINTVLSEVYGPNGQTINVNDYFRGNIKGLFSLTAAAIKENGVLDFFTEMLRERASALQFMKQTLSKEEAKDSMPEEL